MPKKRTSPNRNVQIADQIQRDLGQQPREVVATLLRQRSRNLQEMARRLGLSRASIYEILATVAAMLRVRWPEGQIRLAVLADLREGPVAGRARPRKPDPGWPRRAAVRMGAGRLACPAKNRPRSGTLK